jgi:hypothetical protein
LRRRAAAKGTWPRRRSIRPEGDRCLRSPHWTAGHPPTAATRSACITTAGSFVPPGSDRLLDRAELSTRTVLQSDDAYDRLERDLDEFDVVFAYPWPEEEKLYRKLFLRHAAEGAVLVVYGQLDGVRALRKVAGREE